MTPTTIEYQSFDIVDNGQFYEVEGITPGRRQYDLLAEAKAAIDAAVALMPIWCPRLKLMINYGPVIEGRGRKI